MTTNPVQVPLETFFQRLNILRGLFTILKSNMDQSQKHLGEFLAAHRAMPGKNAAMPLTFFGLTTSFSDLTIFPSDGFQRVQSIGGFAVADEIYLKVIGELVEREAAWSVAQAYEAFETFLKQTAAAYLHANPQLADSNKKKAFSSKPENGLLNESDLGFWRQFVACNYRGKNNKELLKLLRKLAPDIERAESHNCRRADFIGWYRAVAEVRHAATHADFVVKHDCIFDWPAVLVEQFQKWFSVELADKHFRLKLTEANIKEAFRRFAEYAFTIFKALSERQGYDWQRVLEKPVV